MKHLITILFIIIVKFSFSQSSNSLSTKEQIRNEIAEKEKTINLTATQKEKLEIKLEKLLSQTDFNSPKSFSRYLKKRDRIYKSILTKEQYSKTFPEYIEFDIKDKH